MQIEAKWLAQDSASFQSSYVTSKCFALECELAKTQEKPFWNAPFITTDDKGSLIGEYGSDALHWSRIFEYPFIYWTMLPIEGKILDAGGGRSIFQYFLAREAPNAEIINVDHDADYLKDAQQFKGFPNLTITLGDLLELSEVYPEKYFHKAICVSVLEHLKDWNDRQKAVEEILKITKEKVIITMDIRFINHDGLFKPEVGFETFLKNLGVEYPKTIPNPLNSYDPDEPKNPDRRLLILGLIFKL